jgi:hypothetical protein
MIRKRQPWLHPVDAVLVAAVVAEAVAVAAAVAAEAAALAADVAPSARRVAVEQPVDEVAGAAVGAAATRWRQAFRATKGMPRGVPSIPKRLASATRVAGTRRTPFCMLSIHRLEMSFTQVVTPSIAGITMAVLPFQTASSI